MVTTRENQCLTHSIEGLDCENFMEMVDKALEAQEWCNKLKVGLSPESMKNFFPLPLCLLLFCGMARKV